jgi:hypothetical protein
MSFFDDYWYVLLIILKIYEICRTGTQGNRREGSVSSAWSSLICGFDYGDKQNR